MTIAKNQPPARSTSDETAVAHIAQQTATSPDIVKALYEEEYMALNAQATIKTFIGVLASRKVKRILRGLDSNG